MNEHDRFGLSWPCILLAYFVRIASALVQTTFFQPDEYFQALEPALVLSTGGQLGTLTWEWSNENAIRSWTFPGCIAALYRLGSILPINQRQWAVTAPKVALALLTAMGDLATARLVGRLLGRQYTHSALFLSLVSWFSLFVGARSLSNVAEAGLTAIAFDLWPWTGLRPSRAALCAVFLAVVVRPTNAVIWIIPFLNLAWRSIQLGCFRRTFQPVLTLGFLFLFLSVLLDSWGYGRLQFVPWNFFRMNLIGEQPVSLYYGVNDVFWYLTQALPILWWTSSPFIISGAYLLRQTSRAISLLLATSGFTILVYSLLGHKEQRFLLPLQPIFTLCAAYAHVQWRPSWRSQRLTTFLLLLTNLPVAWYALRWHQSGVIEVTSYLHGLPSCESNAPNCLYSLGFLMPCHSTPWQSHLFRPELAADGRLWALTCEPPIGDRGKPSYIDEADLFYLDPVKFLDSCLDVEAQMSAIELCDSRWKGQQRPWPSHLVLFETLLTEIHEVLRKQGYILDRSFFNSHFHDDPRRRGNVLVFRKVYNSV